MTQYPHTVILVALMIAQAVVVMIEGDGDGDYGGCSVDDGDYDDGGGLGSV